MLLRMSSPWTIFFSFILCLSIIWGSLSPHGLTLWLMMEINMYSFIPLILSSSSGINPKEAAMKYLLIQAIGSIIFLLSLIDLQVNYFPLSFSFLMMIMASLLKMGMAPLHFWFPTVLSSLSWPMCSTLLTIQKILPLILISWTIQPTLPSFSSIIFFSSSLSALLGGWGGMNQSMLRPLLAYSSIGHMGWMLASASVSKTLMWAYFSIYLLNILPLMFLFSISIKTPLSELKTLLLLSPKQRISIFLIFLSLGGLPPLLGFFPKLLLISFLTSQSLFLVLFLIMGSLMNLFYYFKFSFLIFLQKSPSSLTSIPLNPYSISPLISMIMMSFFILSWLFF